MLCLEHAFAFRRGRLRVIDRWNQTNKPRSQASFFPPVFDESLSYGTMEGAVKWKAKYRTTARTGGAINSSASINSAATTPLERSKR